MGKRDNAFPEEMETLTERWQIFAKFTNRKRTLDGLRTMFKYHTGTKWATAYD